MQSTGATEGYKMADKNAEFELKPNTSHECDQIVSKDILKIRLSLKIIVSFACDNVKVVSEHYAPQN